MQGKKARRVALDTNVWLSMALAIRGKRLGSPSYALFEAIRRGQILPTISDAAFYELGQALSDLTQEFTAPFIIDFLEIVDELCEHIAVRGLDMGCRDDDDDKIVELAYNGKCDLLVTRDKDLEAHPVPAMLAERGCTVCGVSAALDGLSVPAE